MAIFSEIIYFSTSVFQLGFKLMIAGAGCVGFYVSLTVCLNAFVILR